MQTSSTEVIDALWSGGRTVITIYRFNSKKKLGLRLLVWEHFEKDGTARVQLVEGDGGKATFQIYFDISMPIAEFNR